MTSLIATVLDEKDGLMSWLESILSQTLLPDEIVIVDGGSKDGTWEMLVEKSQQNNLMKVWQQPGNISIGRNTAIAKASGDMIVVTDAGCIYDAHWFKKITEPILSGHSVFVATGFGPWCREGDGLLVYLIASASIPASAEFKRNWLPSSRSVAFKKEIWEKAGGYPEWIPLCEDVVFDLKILKLGIKPAYIREPLVFWRPRTTVKTYFRQLFGYTRSDGHGKLWFHRQITRYAYYLLNILLLLLSVAISPWFLVIIPLLLAGHMRKFWKRWAVFSIDLPLLKKITGFICMPFIVIFGDIAKMCGWPVGVYERFTSQIKSEQ